MRYSLGGPALLVVGGTAASFTPAPRQTTIEGYIAAGLIKIGLMSNYNLFPVSLPIQTNISAQ